MRIVKSLLSLIFYQKFGTHLLWHKLPRRNNAESSVSWIQKIFIFICQANFRLLLLLIIKHALTNCKLLPGGVLTPKKGCIRYTLFVTFS